MEMSLKFDLPWFVKYMKKKKGLDVLEDLVQGILVEEI